MGGVSNFQFTPGTERAFEFAARWTASDAAGPLSPPQLLLGLLAEPECRAALLLAARGIGVEQVRGRWPDLAPLEAGVTPAAPRLSAEVIEAMLAARSRLADYPQPLELATEHLLLGLAAGPNEVAEWFAAQGFDVQQLEAEIHQLAGHEIGAAPLDAPLDDDELAVSAPVGQPPTEQTAVWRILDAAANRAGEGLRVIEDYARFALDDRFLTAECKTLRHELTAGARSLSRRPAAGGSRNPGRRRGGLDPGQRASPGRDGASGRGCLSAGAAGAAEPGRICQDLAPTGRGEARSASLSHVHP